MARKKKKVAKKATKKKVAKKSTTAKKKKTAKKLPPKKKTAKKLPPKKKAAPVKVKRKAKRKAPPKPANPVEGKSIVVSDTHFVGKTADLENSVPLNVPLKDFLETPVDPSAILFASIEAAKEFFEDTAMFGSVESYGDLQIKPATDYLEPSYDFVSGDNGLQLLCNVVSKGEGVNFKTAFKKTIREAETALKEFKRANVIETREEKNRIRTAIKEAELRQKEAAKDIAKTEKRIKEFKAKWG